MLSVHPHPLPDDALLARYRANGAHTDCYATEIPGRPTLTQYVTAFYTTPVFRLERLVLKLALARPSTDEEAAQLAEGRRDTFAAWRVESRNDNQLLLADLQGRTRSWLMVKPDPVNSERTHLYFGSAIVPRENPDSGKRSLGPVFTALMGFHKVYSQVLLASACAGLPRR